MTYKEILALARDNLSIVESGQLAAQLIDDLGKAKFLGTSHWNAEKLGVFHMIISVVTGQLETTPPDFAEKVAAHLRAVADKYPQKGD